MILNDLKRAYDLFEDDVSKEIFDERVRQYFQGERPEHTVSYEYYKESSIVGFNKKPGECRVAICGAGGLGKESLRAWKHAGYEVVCFIDNDRSKSGTYKDGVVVYLPTEFVAIYANEPDVFVIIDNRRLADMFFSEMYELGVDQERIFMTNDDIVRSSFGNIYFDLPELKHDSHEVFLDAGGGSMEGQRALLLIGVKENMTRCIVLNL